MRRGDVVGLCFRALPIWSPGLLGAWMAKVRLVAARRSYPGPWIATTWVTAVHGWSSLIRRRDLHVDGVALSLCIDRGCRQLRCLSNSQVRMSSPT